MKTLSLSLIALTLMAAALPLLSACSTSGQRQQVRQNTRIEQRTEHRQNQRRDWK